ncbi:hypothetical protein DFQ27_008049 [Actinomortierella ambigua]|uniref:NADH dehydrogenase [ubiquinone] 1 alpha subcomplex subunit n=1 Tax=Actinomortierella ambigua TaxID=1343610 RepID=A0A9P6QG30_9FUNG|nr:hypothetical protein DFQ27_008049 [Actinomortierella ambigua]
MASKTLSLSRRIALSWRSMFPGQGRHLIGKDAAGNLYFERPDPNGGWNPRRTVELANPSLQYANYDEANLAVQWQAWLRNTRPLPPTLEEIERDEARKQLTITRAKILDQEWEDRKAELRLQKELDRRAIMSGQLGQKQQQQQSSSSTTTTTTPSSSTSTNAAAAPAASNSTFVDGERLPEIPEEEKSAARKQIEEREKARKAGFKPQVQQGDTFEPETWSPSAVRRR